MKQNWRRLACSLSACLLAAAIAEPAQNFTTLFSFDGTDGSFPRSALVQATNGNFYGATQYGGDNGTCGLGCGAVFEITPTGKLTTLYSFCSQTSCADGQQPYTHCSRPPSQPAPPPVLSQ
jgi:uncharacterized repeat protein (TIGR03803 family)